MPEAGSAVVTQLSATGAITGFGNVFIAFNGGAGARAVARQADGRIVVAGITTGANGSDIAVARILPDTGQLDPSFSPGGQTATAGWCSTSAAPTSPRTRSSSLTAGSCSRAASRSPSGTSWSCA